MSKRILSLGKQEFSSGISDAANGSNQLLNSAFGWQLTDANYPGLFIHVGGPINVDSGQTKIDQPIRSMAIRDVSYVYMAADGGDVYKTTQTPTSATDVTVLRTASPIDSSGLAFFRPPTGTEYMYYWNGTQIGRWDISGTYPTGWTDNHFTGLQSTTYRPTHFFNGNLYYGNGDRIGMILRQCWDCC
jgi:hypothetical protein